MGATFFGRRTLRPYQLHKTREVDFVCALGPELDREHPAVVGAHLTVEALALGRRTVPEQPPHAEVATLFDTREVTGRDQEGRLGARRADGHVDGARNAGHRHLVVDAVRQILPNHPAVGEPDGVRASQAFALANVDGRDGGSLGRARVDDDGDRRTAHLGEALGQVDLARDEDRFAGAKGVQLRELIAGIAEHHALPSVATVALVGRRPREEVGETHRADGNSAGVPADRGQVLARLGLDRGRERERLGRDGREDRHDQGRDAGNDDESEDEPLHQLGVIALVDRERGRAGIGDVVRHDESPSLGPCCSDFQATRKYKFRIQYSRFLG